MSVEDITYVIQSGDLYIKIYKRRHKDWDLSNTNIYKYSKTEVLQWVAPIHILMVSLVLRTQFQTEVDHEIKNMTNYHNESHSHMLGDYVQLELKEKRDWF